VKLPQPGKSIFLTFFRRYNATIVRNGKPLNVRWINTNRMLGWDINCFGLKTAHNNIAKSCYAGYFKSNRGVFIGKSEEILRDDCMKILKEVRFLVEEEKKEVVKEEVVKIDNKKRKGRKR